MRGVRVLMHMFLCPADNQPAVTEAIRGVLQEHYNYDSTVRS